MPRHACCFVVTPKGKKGKEDHLHQNFLLWLSLNMEEDQVDLVISQDTEPSSHLQIVVMEQISDI